MTERQQTLPVEASGATAGSPDESVSAVAPPGTMLALIDRYVRDETIDVDKLERMLALQERLIAKEAESQYNESMERIAQKLVDVRIIRSKAVKYDATKPEAYRYTPLDKIDEVLRPVITPEGITLSDTTEIREGGGALIVTRATHRAGHFREVSIPLPLDTSGGKNNIQAMGSTLSYGRRYNRVNLFNIVTMDDDDGNGGYIDDAQIKNIRELITKGKRDEEKFCVYMAVKTLADMPQRDYHKATSALEEAIAKLSKNPPPADRPEGSSDRSETATPVFPSQVASRPSGRLKPGMR